VLDRLRKAGQSCHPATWWLAAIGLAVMAGQANNVLLVMACISVALVCALFFKTNAAWAQSIRFYLALSVFVVSVRVIFRVIFNGGVASGDTIAFTIPALNFGVGFGAQMQLFGQVGVSTLQAAALDGLRLAAIILSIAMATTLSNPRKLLKSTPAALYEVAAAVSVAINLAPQLIESLQRVRRARALRGRNKGAGALTSIVIPALEDTMDRSLQLAASMDARGFGRRGALTNGQALLTRALSLLSASGFGVGTYLLVATESQSWAVALLLTSCILVFVVIRITAKRNVKTAYRKQKFGLFDITIFLLTGLSVLSTIAAPTIIGLVQK